MQRIGIVGGFAVARFDVVSVYQLQPRFADPANQFFTRAQPQVLGQVRQDEPAFAIGRKVLTQST
jgi:hypothetical protein